MKEFSPVTALEIAFLFYGRQFRGICHLEAYDRRREYLVLRYTKGLSFRECGAAENISKEMASHIIRCGLRILRMPWRKDIWRMLAEERPAIMESSLAKDVFEC